MCFSFRVADTGEEAEGNVRDTNNSPDMSSDGLKNVNSEDGLVTKSAGGDLKDLDIEEFILKGAMPKNLTDMGKHFLRRILIPGSTRELYCY